MASFTTASLTKEKIPRMAFADPQSVTISGTAVSMPRVSSGTDAGGFAAADGLNKLVVSHQYGKRSRRLLRINNAKIAADPLLAGVNVKADMSVSLVVDVPNTGYTVADQKAIVDAFLAYLSAGTGANVSRLLGGEN